MKLNQELLNDPIRYLDADVIQKIRGTKHKIVWEKLPPSMLTAVKREKLKLLIDHYVDYLLTAASWLSVYDVAIRLAVEHQRLAEKELLVKEVNDLIAMLHKHQGSVMLEQGYKLIAHPLITFVLEAYRSKVSTEEREHILNEFLVDKDDLEGVEALKETTTHEKEFAICTNFLRYNYQAAIHVYTIADGYYTIAAAYPHVREYTLLLKEMNHQLKFAENISLRIKDQRNVWKAKSAAKNPRWDAYIDGEGKRIRQIFTDDLQSCSDMSEMWLTYYISLIEVYRFQSLCNIQITRVLELLIFDLPEYKEIKSKISKLNGIVQRKKTRKVMIPEEPAAELVMPDKNELQSLLDELKSVRRAPIRKMLSLDDQVIEPKNVLRPRSNTVSYHNDGADKRGIFYAYIDI